MTTSTPTTPSNPDPLEPLRARFTPSCPPRTTVGDGMEGEGENAGLLDDPPARPVVLRWVWPDRWLLSIGPDISTVLTDAELGQLAVEVCREAGRLGGGGGDDR